MLYQLKPLTLYIVPSSELVGAAPNSHFNVDVEWMQRQCLIIQDAIARQVFVHCESPSPIGHERD